MELDFSEVKVKENSVLIGLSITLAFLLLGGLGWYIQPERLLTWTEWQVFKQHSQYQQELQALTRQADRLAELLELPPDPVRAQIAVEQLYAVMNRDVNLGALAEPEEALLTAGDLLLQWSLGAAGKDTVIEPLDTAQTLIVRAIEQGQDER